MSNSELCLRCNYAYATVMDDNIPVCDNCKKIFNEEPTRTCPVDQTEMKKKLIKNIMIDKCPKCQGIWLDGNEVGLLGNIAAESDYGSSKKEEKSSNLSYGKFWKGFIIGSILS